ncbi:hypothetical protein DFP72DRAFT_1071213 [Ephemerocybe angulata]|uniref:Uncharacterized protein n=1 Tax=Ephemerocybe angulata TaxID=980116 RepID=A0A8H6HSC1_9AGAR|nr:hypothetical protein DFP72DRAFT_1071213 [Tulosesus angulatus]
MLYPLVIVTPLLQDVSKTSVLSFVVDAHDDLGGLHVRLMGFDARHIPDVYSAAYILMKRAIEVDADVRRRRRQHAAECEPEALEERSRAREIRSTIHIEILIISSAPRMPSWTRRFVVTRVATIWGGVECRGIEPSSRYFDPTRQFRVKASSALLSQVVGGDARGVGCRILSLREAESEVRFEDSVRAAGAVPVSRQPWLLRAIWRLGLRRIPAIGEVWGEKLRVIFAVVFTPPSSLASAELCERRLGVRLGIKCRTPTRPVCDGHRNSVGLRVWAGVLIEDSIVSSAVATTRNFVSGIR